MKNLIIPIFFLLSCCISGQTLEAITLTTQSITITGALAVSTWQSDHQNQPYPDYPKLYYAFSGGDEVVLDFVMENKKGTNKLEISEWESKAIVYSNKEFQTLENVRIKLPGTGVYKFEFSTNHMFDRQGNITIKRIPTSESVRSFNSIVTWKLVSDTTFVTEQEKYKLSSVLRAITIQSPTDYFVNSCSNALFKEGSSRIGFPVKLPENTIEWYYTFGATRNESDVQSTKSSMNLAGDLSKLIDQSGSLSLALNLISQPPGANYCDVNLIPFEQSTSFLNKFDDAWKPVLDGTRLNLMSGVVKINSCCLSGKYLIGFRNRDMTYGVHVVIEVVAIVEDAKYETRIVKKPVSVSTKKVPVYGG